MHTLTKIILGFFLLFFCFQKNVDAGVPNFTNITSSQLKTIIEGFSADVFHTNLTPPSSHRTLFFIPGFELGTAVGITRVPKINDFATKDTAFLPYASLIGGVSFPLGISLELSYFPKMKFNELTIDNLGGALKWTVTDVFLKWSLLNAGVRGYYSNTILKYKQTVNATNATVTLDDSTWGGNVSLSKKFLVLEPYVGLGFLHGSSDLTTSVNGIFAPSFTTASSAAASSTGFHLFGGLHISFPLLTLGAEYHRVFESDRLLIKLSLRP